MGTRDVIAISEHPALERWLAENVDSAQSGDALMDIINQLVLGERERCAMVLLSGRFLHDEAPTKKFAIEAAAAIRRHAQPHPTATQQGLENAGRRGEGRSL